nr:helix-turn-helix transcriptional regulator [Microbacterium endophyticum]
MNLARLRHDRGFSFDELAARSGVGRATVVALESGKPRLARDQTATTGTLITWWRLANALGVDLGDLLRPLYEEGPV